MEVSMHGTDSGNDSFSVDQCRLSEKVAVKQILRCVLNEWSCHPESFGYAQDKLREGSAFTLSHYRDSICLDFLTHVHYQQAGFEKGG
jgi:hypothetical protein